MNPLEYQRVSEIFQQACVLDEPERTRFIERACVDDGDLRKAVERMLEQDSATTGTFLDTPLDVGEQPVAGIPADWRMARIGRYEVIAELGRGGMGVVYRAQQDQPRREVALKLIDQRVLGQAAIQRFQSEAELLGRLQHPGIAQIFEAGAVEAMDEAGRIVEGQPFIAMELVDGVPLTKAIDAMDVRERIRLLAEVCDALQHAHQRGVAHLDLKPGNILVDATGRARVLDFGVARALDGDAERTLVSGGGAAVAGTLAYMSREQVAGDVDAIDTRTDIHALGAIGYEMLTGRPPHDVRGFHLVDAMQIVLTAEPRPVLDVAPDVDPELAAVIDKAILPDKEARYASSGELAADLRRWLRYEPVDARPTRHWRSARLFAVRNRPLVVSGLVAMLAIVAGVGALIVGMVRARDAEILAQKRAEDARTARVAAEAETDNARMMATFLEKIIFGVDPERGGKELSFFDAIDYTANRVHVELGDHPAVEASVRGSLGTVYRRHSLYDKADGHLRRSLRLRREVYGNEHPETAKSLIALANHIFEHGGRIEESLLMFEQAERILIANDMGQSLEMGWLALDLGLGYFARDDLRSAERAFERCTMLLEEHRGSDSPDVSRPLRGLAETMLKRGRLVEAEEVARRAVGLCAGWDDEAYIEARARIVLGQVLLEQGAVQEADRVFHDAEVVFRELLRPTHIRMAELDAALSALRFRQDRLADAHQHAEMCLSLREHMLSPQHWGIIEARALVSQAQIEAGGAAEAQPVVRELFEIAERTLGPEHRLTIRIAEVARRCAEVLGDSDQVVVRAAQIDRLRARRMERLQDAPLNRALPDATSTP